MIESIKFDEPIEQSTVRLRAADAPEDPSSDIARARTPPWPVGVVHLGPHTVPDKPLEILVEREGSGADDE